MSWLPRRFGEWVVRWPRAVLAASLVLSLGFGAFAVQQRYYDPYDLWFVQGDPDLESYHQLLRQYGRDDFVLVAFKDPDGIFTNRALSAVLDLTEQLEVTRSVDRVDSITNYQHIEARRTASAEDEDEVSVDDLIRREELPLSAEELARREEAARQEPAVLGSLIGGRAETDGRLTTTAVVARVVVDPESDGAVPVVRRILEVARDIEATHGYRLYVAGVPVVEHSFQVFGWTETMKFVPLLLVTVAVLLLVVLRSLAGLVLPLAIIVLTIVPTLGVMALLGIWLNPLTTIVPQILIAIGVADAVHLVSSFLDARRQGHGQTESAIVTVERNFVPCLVTSLTTAIGFASLLVASVAPMRQLGISAAIGVVLAWVLSMTLIPAALALWPGRPERKRRPAGHHVVDRLLGRNAALVSRHPWGVVVTLGIVFLGVASFMSQVRVETSYKNMFKPETALRQGLAFIEANIGGTVDLEISIDSGRSDGVKDPAFLANVERLQEFLKAQPEVTHTFTIVDVLKRMNQVMNHGDLAFSQIPETSELTAQYLLLYTLSSRRADLKERTDVDDRWTRISARALVTSSDETQALGRRVRRFIADELPELHANVTGKALLYTTMQDKLKESAFNSFASAFLLITLVMTALFRSVKIGVLSIVPNLLPVLGTVGAMGLLDVPLDPGSAIVACVGIGIAVDDTVHFLSKYLRHRATHVAAEALGLALRETGRPIAFTSVILALGFSLFSFSQFNFIAYFGQLATLLIMLALVADLLVLAALVIILDPLSGRQPRAGVWGRARRWLLRTSAVVVISGPLLWPAPAAGATAEGRGQAVMQEQERVNQGYGSEIGRYRMTLVNANGDRSERVMELRTLEGRDEGDRTMITFLAPADISGTGLLTHQRRDRDDDQWLYLPALRRVRRIASANRSSSFVGSEFTYEDLAPRELARYRYRYLRDDTVGDGTVSIVESVPVSRDSGYSKIELAVRKDNHQTVRSAFFDRQGNLAKVAHFEHWTRVDDRWWRARRIRMENVQTRKSTTLELLEIKIGAALSANDFTSRAFER